MGRGKGKKKIKREGGREGRRRERGIKRIGEEGRKVGFLSVFYKKICITLTAQGKNSIKQCLYNSEYTKNH